MCLIALAIDQHPRYPLVIAANRDEYLQRPAAVLGWWHRSPAAVPLLGGRDLQAGGTWMALGANGRVAMLTNVRDPSRLRAAAPSRGDIVPNWLETRRAPEPFWRDTAALGHNPFNLLAGDLHAGSWWWADDRTGPRALDRGLYGLSNAALDTPWPKVQGLKAALTAALAGSVTTSALEHALFAALSDRTVAPDDALPDTGVGPERERRLAPAFIRTPDGAYGTRCSTLLVVERHAGGHSVRYVERQFDVDGRAAGQRGASFGAWPLGAGALPSVHAEPVSAG